MTRARRGMTLLELLVATSIVLVLSIIGWASVEGAIEMSDALSRNDESTRSARVALSRLRRELELAYLTPNRRQNRGEGGEDTFVTVFVGEDDDPDTVWFSTLAHQRLYRDSRASDQAEVSIWVDDAPRDRGPGDILFHRESDRIDDEPDEGGRIWPLAYHVDTFNLRYLDGRTNEWTDAWDSRGGDTPYMLPRAVQIGLVLLAPDPEDDTRTVEVPYVTTVLLRYAQPIQPLLLEASP